MSVLILTDITLSDEEVVRWTEDSLLNYAEFEEVVVTIKEKHERILIPSDLEN